MEHEGFFWLRVGAWLAAALGVFLYLAARTHYKRLVPAAEILRQPGTLSRYEYPDQHVEYKLHGARVAWHENLFLQDDVKKLVTLKVPAHREYWKDGKPIRFATEEEEAEFRHRVEVFFRKVENDTGRGRRKPSRWLISHAPYDYILEYFDPAPVAQQTSTEPSFS